MRVIDLAHGIEPLGVEHCDGRDQADKRGMVMSGIVGRKRRTGGFQFVADRGAAIRLRRGRTGRRWALLRSRGVRG